MGDHSKKSTLSTPAIWLSHPILLGCEKSLTFKGEIAHFPYVSVCRVAVYHQRDHPVFVHPCAFAVAVSIAAAAGVLDLVPLFLLAIPNDFVGQGCLARGDS